MLPTISLVLLALVVIAIVLSRGVGLRDERRILEKHAAVSADELVERATALLRDGGAGGAAKDELLGLLAKRDYDGMLRSMRGAEQSSTELRLIITALSHRGDGDDASSA